MFIYWWTIGIAVYVLLFVSGWLIYTQLLPHRLRLFNLISEFAAMSDFLQHLDHWWQADRSQLLQRALCLEAELSVAAVLLENREHRAELRGEPRSVVVNELQGKWRILLDQKPVSQIEEEQSGDDEVEAQDLSASLTHKYTHTSMSREEYLILKAKEEADASATD